MEYKTKKKTMIDEMMQQQMQWTENKSKDPMINGTTKQPMMVKTKNKRLEKIPCQRIGNC